MDAKELVDQYGRPLTPIVGNESEDGTGTWHVITCDSAGNLKIVVAA